MLQIQSKTATETLKMRKSGTFLATADIHFETATLDRQPIIYNVLKFHQKLDHHVIMVSELSCQNRLMKLIDATFLHGLELGHVNIYLKKPEPVFQYYNLKNVLQPQPSLLQDRRPAMNSKERRFFLYR